MSALTDHWKISNNSNGALWEARGSSGDTELYCAVLYCNVLYFTVLYCTVLYYGDRDNQVTQRLINLYKK